MSNTQLTTLPNGLRVLTDKVDGIESVACGIWFGVGARHEAASINGATHMIEHMLFKGTHTRSALDITQEIESVGGHMNAYTSRELTSYHIHLLADDLSLAIDVLADMAQHSTLPEDELTKERHVILQEIGMCQDTPDDLVFDHYYTAAYPDQPAGRSILGPSDIVANMPRQALLDHMQNYYSADNAVFIAAGKVDHEACIQHVAHHFNALPETTAQGTETALYKGGDFRDHKADLEQAHIVLGFEAPSRLADDAMATKALCNLLGGGMSSRLFQEIREKRGLVYSTYAFYQGLQDSGQIGFYAGTGPEQLTELIPVLCDELCKATSTLSEEELARTKAQMKSALLLGQESMMNRADIQARSMLHKNTIFSALELAAEIDALTVNDLHAAVADMLQKTPTLAALGPLERLDDYDRIKKRLTV